MEQQQASGVNNNFRKPNFLIVGAAKAGTTSLANYLNQHPDIFIPEAKELRFFVKDTILKTNPKDPLLEGILKSSVLDEDDYFALFQRKEKLLGEASVHYLYHYEEAIPKIKKYLGDIPIIIVLRNPVDRAISNIRYLYQSHKSSTIEGEIALEKNRKEDGFNAFWYYTELGLYYNQVKQYLNHFSKVKVLFYEDLKNKPDYFFKEALTFLEVQHIDLSKYNSFNATIHPNWKYRFLQKTGVTKLMGFLFSKQKKEQIKMKIRNHFFIKTELSFQPKTLEQLKGFYKSDVQNLEKLLNKNLTQWYS